MAKPRSLYTLIHSYIRLPVDCVRASCTSSSWWRCHVVSQSLCSHSQFTAGLFAPSRRPAGQKGLDQAPNSAGCTTPPASERRVAMPRSRQTGASVSKQGTCEDVRPVACVRAQKHHQRRRRSATQAAATKQRGAFGGKSANQTQLRHGRNGGVVVESALPLPTPTATDCHSCPQMADACKKKGGRLSCTAPQLSRIDARSSPLFLMLLEIEGHYKQSAFRGLSPLSKRVFLCFLIFHLKNSVNL